MQTLLTEREWAVLTAWQRPKLANPHWCAEQAGLSYPAFIRTLQTLRRKGVVGVADPRPGVAVMWRP